MLHIDRTQKLDCQTSVKCFNSKGDSSLYAVNIAYELVTNHQDLDKYTIKLCFVCHNSLNVDGYI